MLILIDGVYINSSENRYFKGTRGSDVCNFFSKNYNVISCQIACVCVCVCIVTCIRVFILSSDLDLITEAGRNHRDLLVQHLIL